MNNQDFIEQIYEIAFGDNAINRDFSKQEVIERIQYYSNVSATTEETKEEYDHLIDKDGSLMSTNEALQIIDDVVTRECNWADEPTYDIEQAWDKVQVLTRKGIIAEKYVKEWEKQ